MRGLIGLIHVLALGGVWLVGCGDGQGSGGAGGDAGSGGDGGHGAVCADQVCRCTEAGIRAAIGEGGGPFTFDCDGPATITTVSEIVIDKDVILDGEGKLTVDGDQLHRVFSTIDSVAAELRGFTVTNGATEQSGGGIKGNVTLIGSTVSNNTAEGSGGGLDGSVTLIDCTVSGNSAGSDGGESTAAARSPTALSRETRREVTAAVSRGCRPSSAALSRATPREVTAAASTAAPG